MLCRGSAWVAGLTIRALAQWVDGIVILVHMPDNATRDVIHEACIEKRIEGDILCDYTPEWQEMRLRQKMLDRARTLGATHIVICDDDEILSGNLLPYAKRGVQELAFGEPLQLPWPSLETLNTYRDDGVALDQWVTVAFGDRPDLHWAARGEERYDFHHRHPMSVEPLKRNHRPVERGAGGLMHLQFLSPRRLRAKQALYVMTERIRWPEKRTVEELNQMYGLTVYGHNVAYPSKGRVAQVPDSWWKPYEQWMKYLDIEAEPWQEAECRRLLAEHGQEKFAGLDLYGVG